MVNLPSFKLCLGKVVDLSINLSSFLENVSYQQDKIALLMIVRGTEETKRK
jgi:hypothetical protein